MHKDTFVIMLRRLEVLKQLGFKIKSMKDDKSIVSKVHSENAWFTFEFIQDAMICWSLALSEENLTKWIGERSYSDEVEYSKKIGIICAGNIPLVGLHDIICAYLSGNEVFFKPSSDDRVLCLEVAKAIGEIDPKARIKSVEKLNGMDAIIATGSNTTRRHFEYYFKDIPRLLRGARTSVSVLTNEITVNELKLLSNDIFQYFGRGCRSVTHLFLPKDFDIQRLFESWIYWSHIGMHNKYASNYDYQRALLMLNKVKFHENNFVILLEDAVLKPPVGIVSYSRYSDLATLNNTLENYRDEIQTVVGHGFNTAFGDSQNPQLWDYADGINNLYFCINLKD